MSSETSRKLKKEGFDSSHTVLPQPVSDPSIIESVAGFIHEVVPQAYSSVLPGETRESIIWARFESCDYNDPEVYPQVSECESESIPPLLLVLGYYNGVQVWSIGSSGDAQEVLSWSQGTVRTLRFLNKPKDDPDPDPYESKRPIVAIVDSAGPGPQFCTVNFVSLKTSEVVKSIKFKTPICDIYCNKKSIVITFVEKIAVFDVATFEDRLTITTCYPSPGVSANPVALGHRWLAYAEKRLTTWQRSSGGCEGDGAQSYTATAIHAVKTLGKGLRDLSGSLTGNTTPPMNSNAATPGIVTIIDIETKPSKEDETDNIIAHFVAHVGPISALSFDSSGLLLVTADKHGHRFHVFRVHPHPVASQLAAVHHLYVLHRGETTARVQDITVSWDSRWVSVSTVRGTTHVFPITPYGGPVTVRTHTTPNVVNRLSRFERSAGLSDGRGSPLLPEVPTQPLNPRLPPYPHPTTLTALAQLRRTPVGEETPLAGIYAAPRGWIPGKQRGKKPIVESLFIISSGGTLIQYDLDPKCIKGLPKDKISYDTAIELGVEAKAEWSLLKPPYSSNMQPPLTENNPLLANNLIKKIDSLAPLEDRWLSQVEIVTHTGPHRRLWMGPQFSFKSIDPLPSGDEDVMKPVRSNPVNMPHRPPYLLIEGGSGGSVESPHLTGYGSSDEMVHGESRLKEDLADAMMETGAHNTGNVGGMRLKAALLERQVNPLGTVITLPTGDNPCLHHSVVGLPPNEILPLTSRTTEELVSKQFGYGVCVNTVNTVSCKVEPFLFEEECTKVNIETKECVKLDKKSKKKKKITEFVEPLIEAEIEKLPDIIESNSIQDDLINLEITQQSECEIEINQKFETEEVKVEIDNILEAEVEPVLEPVPEPVQEPEPIQEIIENSEIDFSEMLEKRRKNRLMRRAYEAEPKIDDIEKDEFEGKKLKKERRRRDDEKMKSPSPSKNESKTETDSSDEARDEKLSKSKRKRIGKKDIEVSFDISDDVIKLKAKSKSEGTLDIEKSDYETASEKKSDSSIESFPELKKKPDLNGNETKSWSSIVKVVKPKQSNEDKDRDSVYESCNDDEFSNVQEPALQEEKEIIKDLPKNESGSSNTEEKTDSGEKDNNSISQNPKKIKKQKKKRR